MLMIPPGADNHKVMSSTTFERDAVLWNVFPHMHLRGKDSKYKAVFPDGPHRDAAVGAGTTTSLADDLLARKAAGAAQGTRIECTAHFDNSDKNLNNPDPTKLVRWGDQTWEENDDRLRGLLIYGASRKPKRNRR